MMKVTHTARLPWVLRAGVCLVAIWTGCVVLASSAAPVPAPSATLWFIFLDDLHSDFKTTGQLRTLLSAICDELVRDGDLAGSVSTGPSSIAIDLTYDRQRLRAGFRRATGSSLQAVDIFRASQPGPRRSHEPLYRAAVSLSTAYDVMSRLAQVQNIRKAFIYVGKGYEVDLSVAGGAARSENRPTRMPLNLTMADVRDDLFRLIDEARRANVRVFAIDANRLAGPVLVDPVVDRAWWQHHWATTRNSLRVMSEQTGGFALLEEQDLSEGLKRIDSVMRN